MAVAVCAGVGDVLGLTVAEYEPIAVGVEVEDGVGESVAALVAVAVRVTVGVVVGAVVEVAVRVALLIRGATGVMAGVCVGVNSGGCTVAPGVRPVPGMCVPVGVAVQRAGRKNAGAAGVVDAVGVKVRTASPP